MRHTLWLVVVGCTVPEAALQPLVDRPRVLGVRARLPDVPRVGGPVEIDALTVVPPGREVRAVTVEACTLGLLAPAAGQGVECFTVPEFTESIGDRVPVTWTWGPFGAPFDNARTEIPILVGVSDGQDWGYASITIPLDFNAFIPPELPAPSFQIDASATDEGWELEAAIEQPAVEAVWWFNDAGTLDVRPPLQRVDNGVVVSRNQLVGPAENRVYLVTDEARNGTTVGQWWTTVTLD